MARQGAEAASKTAKTMLRPAWSTSCSFHGGVYFEETPGPGPIGSAAAPGAVLRGTRPGAAGPGVYYGIGPSGRLRDWLGRVY